MAILCKKNQIAKIFCRPDTDLNLPKKVDDLHFRPHQDVLAKMLQNIFATLRHWCRPAAALAGVRGEE